MSDAQLDLERSDWPAVVVGGGVVGLTAAWMLAARGDEVLLLEAGRIGSGASSAAAGMLAPYAEIEFHEDELLEFSEASQKLWPQFAAELHERSGVDPEFDDTGTLILATDADSSEALSRQFSYQQSRGAQVAWLTGEACRELEPLLSPYLAAGVHSPGDYQVSNHAVIRGLRATCESHGVTFAEHARVTELEPNAGGTHRIVLSDATLLEARTLVIATGAWTSQLKGLGRLASMIRPVKGQMISLKMTDRLRINHVLRGPHAYLAPKRDGTLVIGATSEEQGFYDEVTAGGVFELLRGTYEMLPASYEMALKDTWSGFRPCSRDNGPLLGETDVEGVYVFAGHYRNGIQQLPATREAIRCSLNGDPLPDWAAPFHCSRFLIAG